MADFSGPLNMLNGSHNWANVLNDFFFVRQGMACMLYDVTVNFYFSIHFPFSASAKMRSKSRFILAVIWSSVMTRMKATLLQPS